MPGPYNTVLQVLAKRKGFTGLTGDLEKLIKVLNSFPTKLTLTVDTKVAKKFASQLTGLNKRTTTLNASLKALSELSLAADRNLSRLTGTMNKLGGATTAARKVSQRVIKTGGVTNEAIKDNIGLWEALGRQTAVTTQRYLGFVVASRVVLGALQGIGGAISNAIKLNTELNKIARISDDINVDNIKVLRSVITGASIKFAVDPQNLAEVAKTFAQTGASLNEIQDVVRSVARTNLLPTFGSTQETLDGLIAVFKQFNIETSESEEVINRFFNLASQRAVEVQDLFNSVKRAGAVFAALSVDVEKPIDALTELAAITTVVRQTTRQSGERIGTALRTIFARVQRPEIIEFLKQFNIELVRSGKFIGGVAAIEEIGRGLRNIPQNSPQFIRVAQQISGLRQIDKIIPILRNYEQIQIAVDLANRGSASSTEAINTAMKDLGTRVQKVFNIYKTLIVELTNDAVFKTVAHGFLTITEAIGTLLNAIRPLINLLLVLGALGVGKQIPNVLRGLRDKLPGFNEGGRVGLQRGGRVPAILTPGEIVVPKKLANKIGLSNLENINRKKSKNSGTGLFLVPGVGNRDSVPADLEPGSFVVRKSSVDGFLNFISNNRFGFRKGGRVGLQGGGIPGSAFLNARLLDVPEFGPIASQVSKLFNAYIDTGLSAERAAAKVTDLRFASNSLPDFASRVKTLVTELEKGSKAIFGFNQQLLLEDKRRGQITRNLKGGGGGASRLGISAERFARGRSNFPDLPAVLITQRPPKTVNTRRNIGGAFVGRRQPSVPRTLLPQELDILSAGTFGKGKSGFKRRFTILTDDDILKYLEPDPVRRKKVITPAIGRRATVVRTDPEKLGRAFGRPTGGALTSRVNLQLASSPSSKVFFEDLGRITEKSSAATIAKASTFGQLRPKRFAGVEGNLGKIARTLNAPVEHMSDVIRKSASSIDDSFIRFNTALEKGAISVNSIRGAIARTSSQVVRAGSLGKFIKGLGGAALTASKSVAGLGAFIATILAQIGISQTDPDTSTGRALRTANNAFIGALIAKQIAQFVVKKGAAGQVAKIAAFNTAGFARVAAAQAGAGVVTKTAIGATSGVAAGAVGATIAKVGFFAKLGGAFTVGAGILAKGIALVGGPVGVAIGTAAAIIISKTIKDATADKEEERKRDLESGNVDKILSTLDRPTFITSSGKSLRRSNFKGRIADLDFRESGLIKTLFRATISRAFDSPFAQKRKLAKGDFTPDADFQRLVAEDQKVALTAVKASENAAETIRDDFEQQFASSVRDIDFSDPKALRKFIDEFIKQDAKRFDQLGKLGTERLFQRTGTAGVLGAAQKVAAGQGVDPEDVGKTIKEVQGRLGLKELARSVLIFDGDISAVKNLIDSLNLFRNVISSVERSVGDISRKIEIFGGGISDIGNTISRSFQVTSPNITREREREISFLGLPTIDEINALRRRIPQRFAGGLTRGTVGRVSGQAAAIELERDLTTGAGELGQIFAKLPAAAQNEILKKIKDAGAGEGSLDLSKVGEDIVRVTRSLVGIVQQNNAALAAAFNTRNKLELQNINNLLKFSDVLKSFKSFNTRFFVRGGLNRAQAGIRDVEQIRQQRLGVLGVQATRNNLQADFLASRGTTRRLLDERENLQQQQRANPLNQSFVKAIADNSLALLKNTQVTDTLRASAQDQIRALENNLLELKAARDRRRGAVLGILGQDPNVTNRQRALGKALFEGEQFRNVRALNDAIQGLRLSLQLKGVEPEKIEDTIAKRVAGTIRGVTRDQNVIDAAEAGKFKVGAIPGVKELDNRRGFIVKELRLSYENQAKIATAQIDNMTGLINQQGVNFDVQFNTALEQGKNIRELNKAINELGQLKDIPDIIDVKHTVGLEFVGDLQTIEPFIKGLVLQVVQDNFPPDGPLAAGGVNNP